MNHALFSAIVLAGSTLLAVLLVPLTRVAARRLGVIDHPGHRKVHSTPTPRLGGIAVFGSFITIVASGHWLAPLLSHSALVEGWIGDTLALFQDVHRVEAKLIGVLSGATLAFLVGLLDDVLGSRFPVTLKAAGQIAAAVVLIVAGVRVSFLPYVWMNVALTLLWLVGMTNAFNLLDNMDGLSAGVAFVASSVLLINAWIMGEFFIAFILVAFMGSLLGFLFFNFEPASVFLGDCGSLFIGFLMGSLTLLERYVTQASSTLFPVLMPVLVLAVPIIDTATVIVIRLREGRPIYVGDQRHLSHRLLSLGLSKRAVALFIYLATFSLGLGATFLGSATLSQSLLLLLQAAGFVTLLLILMFVAHAEDERSKEP